MLLSGAAHTRLLATVITLVSVMSGSGPASYSADLAAEEALNIIANFADRLCTRIPLGGSGENVELSGQAKAELNAVLKKLVDLGIEGAAKYRIDEWQGPLRADLAKMVSESTQCKREVWKDLKYMVLQSNRANSGPSEPAREEEAAEALAVGGRARFVSPGANRVAILASCDSISTRIVSVGQTVRVIEQCPRGDRFCIRAERGGNSLGCALRAQLEPTGRANE